MICMITAKIVILRQKIFNCDVKNGKTNNTMATESSYYYSKSGASQRKSRNAQGTKSKHNGKVSNLDNSKNRIIKKDKIMI